MKKIISSVIIIVLLMQIAIPICTKANETSKKYLALGDSIAYGYALPNKDGQVYSEIVRAKLNIEKNNYKNLAISGKTCEEYYAQIQTPEYEKAIQDADIITISIGSNELLTIATAAVADATGIDPEDPGFLTKAQDVVMNASVLEKARIFKAIYDFFTSEDTKITINAAINSYEIYWNKTVEHIKQVNPNVTIVATEFYNPFYELSLGSLDISGFVDESIRKMNVILEKQSNSESKYKIARIYDSFNTTDPRITNVNISFTNFSLDPHPNVSGHEIIATKVMDCLKNYTGNKTDIATLTISDIMDQAYTGKEIKPQIVVKNGGNVLVENKDYTVTYINNINLGEAKVNIIGIGNYTGNVYKTFNIMNKEQVDISSLNIAKISDCTYTGIKITPDVVIKNGNTQLKSGTDYILKYQNNIDVGTATVIISGTGNYTGKASVSFNVVAKDINDKDVEIKEIKDQKYTGSEITPSISINNGSAKLVKDKDYDISYSNNINIGTGKVTIKGKGNYKGTIEKTFEIKESINEIKDISEINCSEIEDKIYTGKLITPEVTLKDGEKTLKKDEDYTLSYTNNINIGTGTLTITGIGSYTGKVDKQFKIIQKDIKFTQIEDINDHIFTGNEIKPTIVISSDFIKLVEGQDYTIEYKNNISHGTASIIVTGKGNYKGTVTKTFNIVDKEDQTPVTDTADSNIPETGVKEFALFLIIAVVVVAIVARKKILK